jgi:hypothetical protein
MILMVCSIILSLRGIAMKMDVEGKLLASSQENYLVDFSQETRRLHAEGDYSKVIVSQSDCVKEN